MSLSLHTAFVPNAQQTLVAMLGLIDKGETHVKEHGLADSDLIEARLAEDMWALPYHVRSCWVHSAYAIAQLHTGEFTPDFTDAPQSWDAMRAQINEALGELEAITEEEMEALAEKHVRFMLGGKKVAEGTAQNFLLSFHQANLYFHSATFYDILRHKGVALGKRDFLGPVRFQRA